jgi:hypothetical protein
MVSALRESAVPVPPPAYHRAQRQRRPALYLDALTLVPQWPLLARCRLAVRLAPCRCPPPLAAGAGGRPRPSSAESLLRLSLRRARWRRS